MPWIHRSARLAGARGFEDRAARAQAHPPALCETRPSLTAEPAEQTFVERRGVHGSGHRIRADVAAWPADAFRGWPTGSETRKDEPTPNVLSTSISPS